MYHLGCNSAHTHTHTHTHTHSLKIPYVLNLYLKREKQRKTQIWYMCLYMCVCVCVCLCKYRQTETERQSNRGRERDRERARETGKKLLRNWLICLWELTSNKICWADQQVRILGRIYLIILSQNSFFPWKPQVLLLMAIGLCMSSIHVVKSNLLTTDYKC